MVSTSDSKPITQINCAHVEHGNPLLGDVLSLISAVFYAVYITLIRKKLPDDDDEKSGWFSMAQLLGFLGLLNNVLSDYLWAKAVLLTTTTVAWAGLTIQFHWQRL
nr:unnamed protein product [Brassica rapa]